VPPPPACFRVDLVPVLDFSAQLFYASRSSPVAQVTAPSGDFSCRPVSVKSGYCLSRRIMLCSIPFCWSAMAVLSQGGLQFQRRSFHQFGFQFLLEEPPFFYFDSLVLCKALCR
jgi:hypothetical protein